MSHGSAGRPFTILLLPLLFMSLASRILSVEKKANIVFVFFFSCLVVFCFGALVVFV